MPKLRGRLQPKVTCRKANIVYIRCQCMCLWVCRVRARVCVCVTKPTASERDREKEREEPNQVENNSLFFKQPNLSFVKISLKKPRSKIAQNHHYLRMVIATGRPAVKLHFRHFCFIIPHFYHYCKICHGKKI